MTTPAWRRDEEQILQRLAKERQEREAAGASNKPPAKK
jgi:hypothetical protein